MKLPFDSCRFVSCRSFAQLAVAVIGTTGLSAQTKTTSIGFDAAANWIQGSAGFTSYSNHSYAEDSWHFSGTDVFRNGITAQDGSPGALGTHSFRLLDAAGSGLEATFDGAMTVVSFGFEVRRWDENPDPIYSVEYSTDAGVTYLPTGTAINNAFLDDSSAFKTFTFTLSAPVVVNSGDFKVKIARLGGERVMIDNFQWTEIDEEAPELATVNPLSPANEAENVPLDASFSITFNETIQPGGGSVLLYQKADPNPVEIFVVTAENLSAATATFAPTNPLEPETDYYLIVEANAFNDLAGHTFAGLLNDTDWTFTTKGDARFTLELAASSVAESSDTVQATLTRGGSSGYLFVHLASSMPSAAEVEEFVIFEGNENSVIFEITLHDNDFKNEDRLVTITASADGFPSVSENLTVTDDPGEPVIPIVINELDADQAGSDAGEFIELFNLSNEEVSLHGVILVFYNGSGTSEASYRSIDLSGHIIPASGFFVVGNEAVPNVNLIFPNNALQNGADAVALYYGNAVDYPNGTLASEAPGLLVDAVVYGTNDPDATALLAALTPGEVQANEGSVPASETVSIARVPDGGARFATSFYVAQVPTPGAGNQVFAPGNTFADWIAGFDVGGQTGFNHDSDGDGLGNALENYLGTSPEEFSEGLTLVASDGNSVVFRHGISENPAEDIEAAYEWSLDLTDWHASGEVANGVKVNIVAGVPVDGMVTVTAEIIEGTSTRLFTRLGVSEVAE